MIYLIYGNDREGVLKKSHAYLAMLQKKRPNAEISHVSPESWLGLAGEFSLDQLILEQGLFDTKRIVVMSGVFNSKESKKEIMKEVEEKIEEMGKSPHAFIFREVGLTAPILKKFKECAQEVILCDLPKANSKFSFGFSAGGATGATGASSGAGSSLGGGAQAEFNVFSITDAIAKKDKKQAWLLFCDALNAGVEPEPLHGAIWWCFKNAVLAGSARSATETGQSPFVFSKSKAMFALYGEEALQNSLSELITMYHESRRGNFDLMTELERFILK